MSFLFMLLVAAPFFIIFIAALLWGILSMGPRHPKYYVRDGERHPWPEDLAK